jgi:membrane protein
MKPTGLGKICGVTRSDVGTQADSPTRIPLRGWWQVLGRAIGASQKDNISLLAAGVAFFGFLALFPALIALVTLVGLVANPAQITQR